MATQALDRVGFITVGPSNQGKTDYCRRVLIPQLIGRFGCEQVLYTSGDFERQELFDSLEVHLRPAEVWQAVYNKVHTGTDKKAIIIDGTHLQPVYRAASLKALGKAGITHITALVFKSQPLEECQERSRQRQGHSVPASEIERHFRTFVPIGADEGFADIMSF